MFKLSKKVITLAAVMCLAFSTTAYAADVRKARSQSYTKNFTKSFSGPYKDATGSSYIATAKATCRAEIEWEEGITGSAWIVDATFYVPTVTANNKTIDVKRVGTTTYVNSYAYQRFRLNTSSAYIYEEIACDEYGDATFTAEFE